MNTPQLQRAVFLLLLAAVSVAFLWVLSPFFGAVFWAIIMALLFQSVFRSVLLRVRGQRNLAALLTLGVCVLIVVLPAVVLTSSLVNEASALVDRVRGGDVNFGLYAQQVMAALPQWLREVLARFDLVDLPSVLNRFSDGLIKTGQALTTRALSIGQNALMFMVNLVIMLYLLFFFFRDGDQITRMIRDTVPMPRAQTQYLMHKFATVVRATVKGNVVIAIIQGTLGGVAFWALGIHGAVLWGVVMAILSLLPAVGASLVWAPVAIYLVATGSIWQAVALAFWGGVVIGLSDNALRPLLVGRDTKLPDYVVLLTTIGGLSLFGISGFVIGPTIAALFIACWALFKRSASGQEPRLNDEVKAGSVPPPAEQTAATPQNG